nr:zinc finger, CCHC-type [Tanacetum cinerariifolium]
TSKILMGILYKSMEGAQGDREAEVFQVSNDDIAVAQRRLKDKQLEEKTNTDCLRSKHLGVTEIQKRNGLVDETNVTLFAKVRCFLIQSELSKVFWAEDTTMSTYLVNRSPSLAIGFKKPIDMLRVFCWLVSIKQGMLGPIKVKFIFLRYHKSIVGNKLWRLDDVTSKVVLYRNIGFNESGEYKKTFIGSDVGTGSMQVLQGFEFEDLMDYQLARDREQHLVCKLFRYREDSNEAAFAVAVMEKIYAHESLTFNNTVVCEVIFKWKAGLKDDMDARSDVYVLSNSCRKCSDDNDGYYWEYTLGHSILSLKGSLSGDCDVKKNDKWSCIYAVESQEYQMVCTRLDITSVDAGMLDKFDRGLQTYVQVFVDFDYAMGRSITVMESGCELRLVACIATGALIKGCSRSEVPTQVKVVAYRY